MPLRQRIADKWNSFGPAAKTGVIVIGGVAVAVVGGLLIALSKSSPQETVTAPVEEEEVDTDQPTAMWTNHAGGYWVCSHQGCSKKVDPTIFGHACCGRCSQSRWNGCMGAAQREYDGPGSFAHSYFEGLMFPGVCTTCGEPPEAHPWIFDSRAGERRKRTDDSRAGSAD